MSLRDCSQGSGRAAALGEIKVEAFFHVNQMSLLSLSAQPTDNVSKNASNGGRRSATYEKYKITYGAGQTLSDASFLNKRKDVFFFCQDLNNMHCSYITEQNQC